QMNLGSDARAVSVSADLAFVGLSNGQVVVVDVENGGILNRVSLGSGAGAVQDVLVLNEAAYALTVGRLHVLSFQEGVVTKRSEVASPGAIGAAQRRLRLFAGGDRLHATFTSGFNVFDLADPIAPVLLRQHTTAQFGWKQIVANGSGLGFAAVSPNSTDDGPHHVSLHRLAPDGTNAVFLTEFPTPGLASAVAIYNGQGYVADSGAGLQVVNYLAFDSQGQPPTIRMDSNFSLNRAEEGKRMRLSAVVADDVQVRNVEFYVDGRKVATDGNFPFSTSFVTPRAGARSLTVRARASDTGGNATWTDEITVDIVPDASPPFITRTVPAAGAIVGNVSAVTVFFSEPIDPANLGPVSFALIGNGPDGIPNTTDDSPVTGGIFSYRDALNAVVLSFPSNLPPGGYHLRVTGPLSDLAGNPVRALANTGFRVFSGEDVDQDGVPDELESALGLLVGNPDSDGDGTLDGDEDFDRDDLTNAGEILLSTDATNPDTDGDGIRDGDEDTDGDSLTDAREIGLGSSPTRRDTDGDEWTDDAEFLVGSDLTDSRSRPFLQIMAEPPTGLLVPTLAGGEQDLAFGPWLSFPPVGVFLPSDEDFSGLIAGTRMAFPPVSVVLNHFDGGDGLAAGTLLALPPISVVLPRFADEDDDAVSSSTHIALPPVQARIDNGSSAQTP
ncbi:MAG: Ig-like domain-containing protein, partial [Limisphaerales bacterium]